MTAATELASLETVYAAWIAAGCPQSYSLEGRTYTRANMEFIIKRIDNLRAAVARQTDGGFYASAFRDPE